ncbi:MAG: 5-(carboxyamino)imidazole ribonucleotide mutase [Gammaproteobacteria bacterium]|nr:MAG: 5-(carboxyamino)imidazole ribonucleotide mutase [Gammaproteobacteria bacterium]
MSDSFAAILMGSDSDLPVMQGTVDVLARLQVPHTIKIASAHRTPDVVHSYIAEADKQGCGVYICAAGMAAHLAGTVAGLTTKPVIGIPLDSGGGLGGIDALLSTVQMPGGIPVATVAIGKAGARNAAYLAAQILASTDEKLAKRIKLERETNAEKVKEKDADLQKKLKRSE